MGPGWPVRFPWHGAQRTHRAEGVPHTALLLPRNGEVPRRDGMGMPAWAGVHPDATVEQPRAPPVVELGALLSGSGCRADQASSRMTALRPLRFTEAMPRSIDDLEEYISLRPMTSLLAARRTK